MGRLDGQTAIVTGSVRGIGLGIARRLAADGCRIVVWDRDAAAFDPGSAGFTPALILAVDIADRNSVERAFAMRAPVVLEVMSAHELPWTEMHPTGWWDITVPAYHGDTRDDYVNKRGF